MAFPGDSKRLRSLIAALQRFTSNAAPEQSHHTKPHPYSSFLKPVSFEKDTSEKVLQDFMQEVFGLLQEHELSLFLENVTTLLEAMDAESANRPGIEGILEPLLWAATTEGDVKIVKACLKLTRMNLNWRDGEHQRSSFYRACSHGRDKVVAIMLGDGRVDPMLPIELGATPFFIACQEGYEKVVILLLQDKRVDPNQMDNNGVSPFFIACQNKRYDLLRVLCSTNVVDVNKARPDGCSALFYSVAHRELLVTKWILSSGPHVNLDAKWTPSGRSSIQQAREMREPECLACLEKYQENPTQAFRSLREVFKTPHTRAGDIFALMVLLCDDFVQIRSDLDSPEAEKTAAFFRFARKLSLDLQMVLSNRTVGLAHEYIPATRMESCTKTAFVAFEVERVPREATLED